MTVKEMTKLRGLIVAWSALAMLASACHGSPTTVPTSAPAGTTPPAAVAALQAPMAVLGANGDVVAEPSGDVWFCVPIGYYATVDDPPRCDEVRAVGVDVSRLPKPERYEDGTVESYAHLAGTLRDNTLSVTNQGPPVQERSWPFMETPPCPPPRGGWASTGDVNADFRAVGAYRRQFPSDVTSVAAFSPERRTPVVTLASINPERTRAHLAKAYPRKLCVVRSLYTRTDHYQARRLLASLLKQASPYELPFVIYGYGDTVSDAGQPRVDVDVLYDTPELERALASQPRGLIHVEPWLTPVTW
jgi:hypothetical protein